MRTQHWSADNRQIIVVPELNSQGRIAWRSIACLGAAVLLSSSALVALFATTF
jgi:hypothetical protein